MTDDICCAICLDDVDSSMNIIKTECNHCFHSKCFLQNAAHNGFNCPMCRNELASVPTSEEDSDDDDSDDYDSDDYDDDDEDYILRGLRWLMMRAEGEDIEEDDDDSVMSDDSDIYLRFDPEVDEEFPNTSSIEHISQRLVAEGVTFEQLVALYVLPHFENTSDISVYSKPMLKTLRKTINKVVFDDAVHEI